MILRFCDSKILTRISLWNTRSHLQFISRNFTVPFLDDCPASAQTDLLELFIWCPVLQRGNHEPLQGLAMLVPGQDSSTELPTSCFYWQENEGDGVWSYMGLLWTSAQRHFLKIFSLHWSTSDVKAQRWSSLRFECQLHFYWPSVTSKGFSSTNVQTGRLPWNLSAMLTYRFWTDFICRFMPENEHWAYWGRN